MKRIRSSLLIIISFSLLQGMELDNNLEKQINTIITETSNNNDDLRSSYPQPNISPQSSPLQHSPQIPRLNLTPALTKSKSIKNTPKTPIKTHNQLMVEIGQAKKTHRQMMSESNSQINVNGKGEVEINNNNGMVNDPLVQKKKSMLPRALINNDTVIDINEVSYTIEYVWNAIKASNRVLYDFAIANNLSIDDAILYGNFLNDNNVHPETLVEFVKNNCEKSNGNKVKSSKKFISLGEEKAVSEALIQKYKKMQDKKSEKYQELVLDLLSSVIAEQDGQNVSSPLNDTHIQVLEKKATESEATTRYQYVALAVTTLLSVGAFAWGIYGQVTGTATLAPTHTPTNTPTSVPTLMPTGTPT